MRNKVWRWSESAQCQHFEYTALMSQIDRQSAVSGRDYSQLRTATLNLSAVPIADQGLAAEIGGVGLARQLLASLPGLNPVLANMLLEHHEHRSERRGAGFTQVSRWLAERINVPRSASDASALARTTREAIVSALEQCQVLTDGQQLLVTLFRALVAPTQNDLIELCPIAPEKLKIGTCPLAEQFFLEIARGRIRRGGQVNLVLDQHAQPVLLEKRGLGDEHSAITLCAVQINAVPLPPGTLIGLDYDDAILADLADTDNARGKLIPLEAVRYFRFLRLTTLVSKPSDRAKVFSTHFDQQIQNALFLPDSTEITDLQDYAHSQLSRFRNRGRA